MKTISELTAEQERIKAEIIAARKAENAAANARKRAAKSLVKWCNKHIGSLAPSEAGIVEDLVSGLDPKPVVTG